MTVYNYSDGDITLTGVGATDELIFQNDAGGTIDHTHFSFEKLNDDLLIHTNAGSVITIENYFLGAVAAYETLTFDQTSIDLTVNNLVISEEADPDRYGLFDRSGDSIILAGDISQIHHIFGDDYDYGSVNLNAGDDIIYGSRVADSISGDGGNDIIYGGFGNDFLAGGAGDDIVYGGEGSDQITNDDGGNDIIFAGAGDDYVSGGADNDEIYGGDGDDSLQGLAGDNILHGGNGNDVLGGGGGDDQIDGGAGDDIIFAGAGDDTIYYSEGADTIDGGLGSDSVDYQTHYILHDEGVIVDLTIGISSTGDTLVSIENVHGTATNDDFYGNDADNVFYGYGSSDDFFSSIGADTYYGGDGDDRVLYRFATSSVTVNLLSGLTGGAAQGDTYNSIEKVGGTEYDDHISGDNNDNDIYGRDGNDQIFGFDGYDYLDGGKGDDYLDGGNGGGRLQGEEGNDTIIGGEGSDYIEGDEGNDVIKGGAGADSIDGDDGDDTIYGEEGNDRIDGGSGKDKIRGGDGNDDIDAGADNDTDVTGDEGDDTVDGGDGDDIVQGSEGNDTVLGGLGNDQVYGDDKAGLLIGNDTLDGGEGNDKLRGGLGDDTYIFSSGMDNIYDLDGNDTLHFGAGYNLIDLDIQIDPNDNDSLLITSGTDSVKIINHLDVASSIETITFDDGSFANLGNWVNWQYVSDYSESGTSISDTLLATVGTPSGGGVKLDGLEGDDQIFGNNGSDVIGGNQGDDFINGGDGLDAAYYVGNFSDYIISGNTVEDLVGDEGTDTLINVEVLMFHDVRYDYDGGVISPRNFSEYYYGDAELQVFYGSHHDDDWVTYVNVFPGAAGVTIDLLNGTASGGFAEGDVLYSIENIEGSDYDDILIGNAGRNTFMGGPGDDTYVYNGGLDVIIDSRGMDNLFIDSTFRPQDIASLTVTGQDIDIVFEAGVHELDLNLNYNSPHSGVNSTMVLNFADGFFIDLTNVDVWRFDTSGDQFDENGQPYNKAVILGDGNHSYSAGAGENYIHVGDGSDTVFGGNDMDVIFGGDGDDAKLSGKEGNDIIDGGDGDDNNVRGDEGDDIVRGGAGNDRLFGDDMYYAGVVVGNDTLDGGEGNDELLGGLGNDTYLASAGSDYLYDLGGIDSLVFGDDWLIYDLAFMRDAVDTNDQDIFFGANQIHIENQTHSSGDFAVETLGFSDGSFVDYTTILDWVFANDTGEIIQGSYHRDDTIIGGDGNDKLYGKDGMDYLFGGLGDDYLRGDNGNDVIHGGEGNDNLRGFADDDLLFAGAGQDRLEGHSGADQFIFFGQEVIDGNLNRVVDFTASDGDVIRLENILEGYDPLTDSINDFIQMSTTGHTYLDIDIDGTVVNHGFVADVIRIEHTGGDWTDAQDMIDQGHLIIA